MSDAPSPEYGSGTRSSDAGLPDTGRTMRLPRRRGAVSGVLLVLLGAWAALAPFVGPYFHFAYTPHPRQSWHWTAARGWYEVLPGGLAVFAGLVLLVSTHRIVTVFAAWLAALAGGWLVVGPTASIVLRLGSIGRPDAATDRRYVAEMLAFFPGAGALLILVAAIAIGRLSARTVGDVRAAAARQEAEDDGTLRGYDADDRTPEEPEPYAGDDDAPYRRPERDEDIRPVATVAGAGAGAGLAAAAAQDEHGVPEGRDVHGVDGMHEAQPAADETAELPVAEPATAAEREQDTEAFEASRADEEHEPLVLEPPAGVEPGGATAAAPAESGAPIQVWNPEDQHPTTTGELPRVDANRPPDQPRRYYRPPAAPEAAAEPTEPQPTAEPVPESQPGVTTELPTRSAPEPIRQDEDMHDLDLDEAPSRGR